MADPWVFGNICLSFFETFSFFFEGCRGGNHQKLLSVRADLNCSPITVKWGVKGQFWGVLLYNSRRVGDRSIKLSAFYVEFGALHACHIKVFKIYTCILFFIIFHHCPLAPQCGVLRDTYIIPRNGHQMPTIGVWKGTQFIYWNVLHILSQNKSGSFTTNDLFSQLRVMQFTLVENVLIIR